MKTSYGFDKVEWAIWAAMFIVIALFATLIIVG
jgi:hypothetical protein